MEGKFIYLIFLAVYFYLQYRAAQKKKQREQEQTGSNPKPKPEKGRGFRTLDDILKEAQRQIQEAQQKKQTVAPQPKVSTKKDKTFTSSSYKSLADSHNKAKSTYTPLSMEVYTGVEGESVFTQRELEESHINDVQETLKAPSFSLDLRQAVIADAVLNRPYE